MLIKYKYLPVGSNRHFFLVVVVVVVDVHLLILETRGEKKLN